MFDIQSGQTTQVAAHDDTIRSVRFAQVGGAKMLVTGSWDKTLKYWDLRQQQPAATVSLQERVYALDVAQSLLVVGTAGRDVNVIDLANPQVIYKTIPSPLKWQLRAITCFRDATGFAMGSIEGRCAIQYIEEKNAAYVFPTEVVFSFESMLIPVCYPQDELLFQVPQGAGPAWSYKRRRFWSQRHLDPSNPRNVFHRRRRRYIQLLG